jgi:hypothetical protein
MDFLTAKEDRDCSPTFSSKPKRLVSPQVQATTERIPSTGWPHRPV